LSLKRVLGSEVGRATVQADDDVRQLVRVAIRGAATYRLSWFDAHIWAYAERFGLDTLWSENFEDGRLHGRVRARDPFGGSG
jgi:predicted nucleic acid-binding protein